MAEPQVKRAIILRYHEIALKGKNRGWFEERLAINARKLIRRALAESGLPDQIEIVRQHGRIVIYTDWNESVRQAISRVFGLTGYSPVRVVLTSKEDILRGSLEEFATLVKTHGLPNSFRVLTRRSDKALPEKSTELDYLMGGTIKETYPSLKVDLEDPQATLGIEVRFKESFIWTEKFPGPGGLPVGTNAGVMCLISGGIDSPVAALQIMKRGSPVSFIHFHGAPFVGPEVLEKIEDLVRIVNRYQPDPQPLHVVPFGKLQEKIALVTNPKMRTILYRRMMIRIACALAPKLNAQALVTGESLGQVASQTVENLATVNAVATLPILRPLIGYDKDEIIEKARHWGTYETSIRPGLDCCTLFADRHPALRTTAVIANAEELKFPVQEWVDEAVACTNGF